MQEFFSITASSYDAESLTPMLTEKSAEGWAVVSIVAAGTNIVAYLSRESADAGPTGSGAANTSSSVSAVASEVTDAGGEPADAAAAGSDATNAYAAAVVDTPTLPGNDTPYVPADSSIPTESAATPTVAAVDAANVTAAAAAAAAEPAGWAAAPDNDVADLAAQVGADDAAGMADSDDQAVAATSGVADQAVDADAGAATESSVPAGWYADPSGRYELRYWDGSAWTEHVSRAGQQFTDPPVA